MSSFVICSSQYGVNGIKSVSVVRPGAKVARLWVEEDLTTVVTDFSAIASMLASISAALELFPSAKADLAFSSQLLSTSKGHESI